MNGIGRPGDNSKIRGIAQRLSACVGGSVLGGLAVILHGYPRTTTDLDFYTLDRGVTYAQLKAAGARWHTANREHVIDAVRIHTVTPEDAGHVARETCVIDGVRVVSLRDLLAIKLRCGLVNVAGSKHVADVEALIEFVPLDKRFAAKIPRDLRADFKRIVDAVRAGERDRRDKPRF